ncbi:hypothetical protein MMC17_008575 [Xylographa soralifera]|nr:hypothetical protein [Xylographa soralifera]
MPSTEDIDTTGISRYSIPDFKFLDGSSLSIEVAYRSFNPSAAKVICIPTCYGGRINSTLNFTSGALKDYHVVVIAMLGNGESTSPSNTAEGQFPQLDYQDVVKSQYELLTQHLEVKELEAVIGFSMGGQQAFYWACMYPNFMKVSIPICGSAKTSPHNWAFLEGPKSALLNSVDYADGAYRVKGINPIRGLHAFGRAYCAWAMSAAWFREKIWQKELGFETVDDFMVAEWERSFESWDPEDLLVLARMWQAADIGALRKDGDYTKALKDVKARVLVMPARTDQYFPPEDSEIEVKHLKHGELAVLETIWGHIGGGGANNADTEWMDRRIAAFLRQ